MTRRLGAVCLVVAAAALGGCTEPTDCSGGVYRSGCAPGLAGSASVAVRPAAPAVARPAPAGGGAGAIAYGDPASFADVDDRQCKSYGLVFGSHDYADCRIRLSAQHRGLDPNIGSPAAAGSR